MRADAHGARRLCAPCCTHVSVRPGRDDQRQRARRRGAGTRALTGHREPEAPGRRSCRAGRRRRVHDHRQLAAATAGLRPARAAHVDDAADRPVRSRPAVEARAGGCRGRRPQSRIQRDARSPRGRATLEQSARADRPGERAHAARTRATRRGRPDPHRRRAAARGTQTRGPTPNAPRDRGTPGCGPGRRGGCPRDRARTAAPGARRTRAT